MPNQPLDPPEPLRNKLPRGAIKYPLAVLVVLIWVLDWVLFPLRKVGLLRIVAEVAELSILFAVISYVMTADDRAAVAHDARKQKHFQAWEIIVMGTGKASSAGRQDALEDLNDDSVSLARIDLGGALLGNVRLAGGDLTGAKLERLSARASDFQDANLLGANLYAADLGGADLRNANFTATNLVGACLHANLDSASFANSDMRGASLINASMEGTNLYFADLRYAELPEEDSLPVSSIAGANIFGAVATEAFIKWALSAGAVSFESTDDWEATAAVDYRWPVNRQWEEWRTVQRRSQARRGRLCFGVAEQ